jgi:hypothetical protein
MYKSMGDSTSMLVPSTPSHTSHNMSHHTSYSTELDVRTLKDAHGGYSSQSPSLL